MTVQWMSLWTDESGYLVSAELALLGTVAGVGLVAGLSAAQDAMNQELDNVAGAMRSLDQSYGLRGFKNYSRDGRLKSWTGSSFYFDKEHEEKNAEIIEAFSHDEGRHVELNRCEKRVDSSTVAPVLVPPRSESLPDVDGLQPPMTYEVQPPVVPRRFETAPPTLLPMPATPPVVRHDVGEPCAPSTAVRSYPSQVPFERQPCAVPCPSSFPWPRQHFGTALPWNDPAGNISNHLPLNPLASPAGPVGLVW